MLILHPRSIATSPIREQRRKSGSPPRAPPSSDEPGCAVERVAQEEALKPEALLQTASKPQAPLQNLNLNELKDLKDKLVCQYL